jgi:hypothetical protein
MSFRKYQKTERNSVLSPRKHNLIGKVLKKTGRKSVADLTEEEKDSLDRKLRRAS